MKKLPKNLFEHGIQGRRFCGRGLLLPRVAGRVAADPCPRPGAAEAGPGRLSLGAHTEHISFCFRKNVTDF